MAENNSAVGREQQLLSVLRTFGKMYRAVYYVNIAAGTCEAIVDPADFSVRMNEGETLSEKMTCLIGVLLDVEPVDCQRELDFVRPESMAARLAERDSADCDAMTAEGHWLRLTITAVRRSEDGRVTACLLAVRSYDEEKRQELDYLQRIRQINNHQANSLAHQKKQLHIIEALARSYSYTCYFDLKTGAFEEISGMDYVTDLVGTRGTAEAALDIYINRIVEPDYREAMRSFLNLSTLKERLMEQTTISQEYVSAYLGWCRGIISVAGRDRKGEPIGVIYGLQSIAGEKSRESELLTTISDYSEKAYIDPITGVRNRRYFDENMAELAEGYSVAMVDMDDFAEINDAYGVGVGDVVLRGVAREILGCIRQEDRVVRHGENYFVISFRQGTEDDIRRRLEKIRRSVETMNIPQYPDVHTTVSIGCAFRNDSTNLFMTADKMLYRAKQTKNIVAL